MRISDWSSDVCSSDLLDIAFNNAGITGALGPIMEIEADHWDASFAVMARGVFLGTKHAARIMAPQGGGAIVNTASIAGLAGRVITLLYSATKAAVVRLTHTAANERAQYRRRIYTAFLRTGKRSVGTECISTGW